MDESTNVTMSSEEGDTRAGLDRGEDLQSRSRRLREEFSVEELEARKKFCL